MSKVDVSKETVELSEVANGGLLLKINHAPFYTRKDDSQFKKEVHTKGCTIYVNGDNEQDLKKIQDFGLTVYSATDKDTKEKVFFIMANFSGNAIRYDTDTMTKVRETLDDDKPNFNGVDYDFALMTIDNEHNPKKPFIRITAYKGASSNLHSTAINYFGDDDKFTNQSEQDK